MVVSPADATLLLATYQYLIDSAEVDVETLLTDSAGPTRAAELKEGRKTPETPQRNRAGRRSSAWVAAARW